MLNIYCQWICGVPIHAILHGLECLTINNLTKPLNWQSLELVSVLWPHRVAIC